MEMAEGRHLLHWVHKWYCYSTVHRILMVLSKRTPLGKWSSTDSGGPDTSTQGLIYISGGGLPPLWERSPFENGSYALHGQVCQGLVNRNLSTKGMGQVGPRPLKNTGYCHSSFSHQNWLVRLSHWKYNMLFWRTKRNQANMKTSSLLTSFYSSRRFYPGYWERKCTNGDPAANPACYNSDFQTRGATSEIGYKASGGNQLLWDWIWNLVRSKDSRPGVVDLVQSP